MEMPFKYSVLCLLLIQMNIKSTCSFMSVGNDASTPRKTRQEIQSDILKDILNDKYDKTVRPRGGNSTYANGNGPTVVTVNMYVRKLTFYEDVNVSMEYTTQLTFRQQWLDTRLRFDNYTKDSERLNIRYVTLLDATKVWTPDLFFSNEVSAYIHDLMSPDIYIRIFPDGEVLYSIRLTLKFFCNLNLKQFPYDQQTCTIRIASWAFTNDDEQLVWKKSDPVQVTSDLVLQNFQLDAFTTDYCDSQTYSGVYSCLRVDFHLRRILQPWIDNVFLPAIMVVILAWLGCWINESRFSTARALIGLSSLFIIFVEFGRVKSSIKQTGYRKAIDIWMGWCLLFVFSTLIEFIVVTHFSRISRSPAKMMCSQTDEIPLGGNQLDLEVRGPHDSNIARRFQTWCAKLMVSEQIDIAFRILYPISFALFCFFYFTSYGGSESQIQTQIHSGPRRLRTTWWYARSKSE